MEDEQPQTSRTGPKGEDELKKVDPDLVLQRNIESVETCKSVLQRVVIVDSKCRGFQPTPSACSREWCPYCLWLMHVSTVAQVTMTCGILVPADKTMLAIVVGVTAQVVLIARHPPNQGMRSVRSAMTT